MIYIGKKRLNLEIESLKYFSKGNEIKQLSKIPVIQIADIKEYRVSQ